MKIITVRLLAIAALCVCGIQIIRPYTVVIKLVAEDVRANFLYAIGSMDENLCDFPNPIELTYKVINGGGKGVLIAFDNTLINWLFVRESKDVKPYPRYGFNLKNTQTLQMGGYNCVVIRRDGTIGYDMVENL
ncbi:hypothetical protein JST99_01265 [Candidatus Dependentiae bacterium]|nr:hypothetical protein [Candidatus Dependentiae bacterium]